MVTWLRCGNKVSGFGLSNWKDGSPLSSVLVNKHLGQMDMSVVLMIGKATSYYFGLVVACYWICS